MLDLEISLVQSHHWSLKDIDETDVTSLLMFAERYAETEGGQALDAPQTPPSSQPSPPPSRGRRGKKKQRAYIDQLNWS